MICWSRPRMLNLGFLGSITKEASSIVCGGTGTVLCKLRNKAVFWELENSSCCTKLQSQNLSHQCTKKRLHRRHEPPRLIISRVIFQGAFRYLRTLHSPAQLCLFTFPSRSKHVRRSPSCSIAPCNTFNIVVRK